MTLTGIGAAFAVGPANGAYTILIVGTLGLLMGLLFKNAVPGRRTVLVSILVTLAIQLLILGFTYQQFLQEMNQFQSEIEKNPTEFLQMNSQAGIIGTQPGQLSESELLEWLDRMITLMIQLAPGITVVTGTIAVVANYYLACRYLKNRRLSVPDDLSLATWRAPWYVIWVMISGLLLYLVGGGQGIAGVIGKNLIFVSGFFSLAMGIAILKYYLARAGLSTFLKILIIFTLVMTATVSIIILAIIGLFDPIVNFRRLSADSR